MTQQKSNKLKLEPRPESRDTAKLLAPPAPNAPLGEWALWCAEAGRLTGAWKVFPCVSGEKRPLHKGWQAEAADDPKTVKAMWHNDPSANIGLAMQPGFVAIDGDLYKPGAEAKLDAFEKKCGRLPETMEFRSGRGGVHLFYRTSQVFGNARGELPDFGDVRGVGGYVVGPGSVVEGNRYHAEYVQNLEALPSHIEGMLRAKKPRESNEARTSPQFVIVDDARNVARFTEWLKSKAQVSIEHHGGNNTLAKTGAMGHSYGLSEAVTLQLMAEHWNPRCEPPWDLEDLEKHGGSGYRSGDSPFGNMAARDFSKLFKPVPKDTTWPAGLFNGPDYQTRPAPRWLIDRAIETHDWGLISGPSGSLKTQDAISLAMSVITGKPWYGRSVTSTGPVLYIALEGQGFFWNRVIAWCQEYGVEPSALRNKLFVFDGTMPDDSAFKLNRPDGVEMLRRLVDQIERTSRQAPALIVVDTVREALSGSVSDEDDVSPFIDAVKATARRGPAVALIGHVSKEAKAAGRQSREPKGLGDWYDRASFVAMKDANGKKGTASLYFSKVKNAQGHFSIPLQIIKQGESLVQRLDENAKVANDDTTPKRGGKRVQVSSAEYAAWAMACGEVLEANSGRLNRNDLARLVANRLAEQGGIARPARAISSFLGRAGEAADHEPSAWVRHLIHPETGGKGLLEFSNPNAFPGLKAKRHKRIMPPHALFRPVDREENE